MECVSCGNSNNNKIVYNVDKNAYVCDCCGQNIFKYNIDNEELVNIPSDSILSIHE